MTELDWRIGYWSISFIPWWPRIHSPQTLTKLVTCVNEVVCLILGRQLLSNSMNHQNEVCTWYIRFLRIDLFISYHIANNRGHTKGDISSCIAAFLLFPLRSLPNLSAPSLNLSAPSFSLSAPSFNLSAPSFRSSNTLELLSLPPGGASGLSGFGPTALGRRE
jgi:hypothetical protein